MTDIVERLRTAYLTGPDRDVLTEAAAEIERLTNEVEEQARLNGMGAERELGLRAEINRLRAALNFYASAMVTNPSPGRPHGGKCDDGYHARRALEPKP